MKKKVILLISIVLIVILIGSLSFLLKAKPKATEVKSGDYFPIPSITANEDYGKDFKTYNSDWGFSFKYPPHMKVVTNPEMPNWVVVEYPQKSENDMTAIVISVGENDENMTAEQWLLGPTSGFKHEDKYFKTTIDGQNAVYTDGGMWTVVNMPGNKYRLSIADLVRGNGDIPFTEMGIITESISFSK